MSESRQLVDTIIPCQWFPLMLLYLLIKLTAVVDVVVDVVDVVVWDKN